MQHTRLCIRLAAKTACASYLGDEAVLRRRLEQQRQSSEYCLDEFREATINLKYQGRQAIKGCGSSVMSIIWWFG